MDSLEAAYGGVSEGGISPLANKNVVIIGAGGVARPIGFGLDENAVEAIHKASFEPAIKDGKPVPVMLDLVVEFHIYSNTTGAPTHPEDVAKPEEAAKPVEPSLPGPYSVPHP